MEEEQEKSLAPSASRRQRRHARGSKVKVKVKCGGEFLRYGAPRTGVAVQYSTMVQYRSCYCRITVFVYSTVPRVLRSDFLKLLFF